MTKQITSRLFEGRLERVTKGVASGWAWEPANPRSVVFVDLLVDDQLVCTSVASASRGDLRRANKRGGDCGFQAPIPKRFLDNRVHTVRIQVADSGSRTVLGTLQVQLDAVEPQGNDGIQITNLYFEHTTGPSGKTKTARALLGAGDWLFLSDDSNRVLDQLCGRFPASEKTLGEYKRVFRERHEKFSRLEIPYLFCVAPTKEIIYQDLLPPGIKIDLEKFPLTQIKESLADEGVELICLHEELMSSRVKGDVYHKTDTHWNDLGAFSAYRYIMNKLSEFVPTLRVLEFGELSSSQGKPYSGDLAEKPKVMWSTDGEIVPCEPGYFGSTRFVETPTYFRTSNDESVYDGFVDEYLKVSETRPTIVKLNADKSLPKILVFHDSFMLGLMKYIPHSFSRAVFVWKPEVHFDIVEREQPDIVLHLMLDRFMVRAPIS